MADSANCKETVWHQSGNWGHSIQCSRKAKRDGYCTQHHPDSAKARHKSSKDKWDRHFARKALMRDVGSLQHATETKMLCGPCTSKLEEEIASLLRQVQGLGGRGAE